MLSKKSVLLGFEGAMTIVNDLPNHIVLNHFYKLFSFD